MKILKKASISPYVDVCQQGCERLTCNCFGQYTCPRRSGGGGGCTLGGYGFC